MSSEKVCGYSSCTEPTHDIKVPDANNSKVPQAAHVYNWPEAVVDIVVVLAILAGVLGLFGTCYGLWTYEKPTDTQTTVEP